MLDGIASQKSASLFLLAMSYLFILILLGSNGSSQINIEGGVIASGVAKGNAARQSRRASSIVNDLPHQATDTPLTTPPTPPVAHTAHKSWGGRFSSAGHTGQFQSIVISFFHKERWYF